MSSKNQTIETSRPRFSHVSSYDTRKKQAEEAKRLADIADAVADLAVRLGGDEGLSQTAEELIDESYFYAELSRRSPDDTAGIMSEPSGGYPGGNHAVKGTVIADWDYKGTLGGGTPSNPLRIPGIVHR